VDIQQNRAEEIIMKKGFYTALGTPLDSEGHFIAESYEKHIGSQIEAGASGMLIMGSMGRQHTIANGEYAKVAAAGAKAIRSRCASFVGAMDNSFRRVMDRIEALGKIDIDGVVVTTPFYYKEKTDVIHKFFETIADASRYPVYLYDLPVVTQNPLSVSDVKRLMKHPNIKGIKTANMVIAREVLKDEEKPADFKVFFSGLDVMDIAYRSGIEYGLDGMFACTPAASREMFTALIAGDYIKAGACLDWILDLRQLFACTSIFPSFTSAMNMLGFEGTFHPDYYIENNGNDDVKIFEYMKKYENVEMRSSK
jgi:4-hydroxy-tetrahydrodipicolinate synthase